MVLVTKYDSNTKSYLYVQVRITACQVTTTATACDPSLPDHMISSNNHLPGIKTTATLQQLPDPPLPNQMRLSNVTVPMPLLLYRTQCHFEYKILEMVWS